MTCAQARENLLASIRGRIDAELDRELHAHAERCDTCAAAMHAERVLDEVLTRGITWYDAPASLRSRLALMAGPDRPDRAGPRGRPRWASALARPLAIALSVVALAGAALWWRQQGRTGSEPALLVAELVNDHLRALAREHPVDIESRGEHEVKPWFEGKLDFAPEVPLPDVPDLRLRGGAVGYVFDRKAAVVLYSLRLHAVTLTVFRPGPASGRLAGGDAGGLHRQTTRGFHVVWWRAGDLLYALVSDVNAGELDALAGRFAVASDPSGTR